MRHIKIIFLITVLIITYLIYLLANNNKVDYLVIGDTLAIGKTPYGSYNYGYKLGVKQMLEDQEMLKSYDDSFTDEYISIKELTSDIINNITKEDINLKNKLRESELLTISIGNQELEKILNPFIIEINGLTFTDVKNQLDEILTDLEELFKEIKRYAVNEVIMVGFYNLYPYQTEKYIDETKNILDYLIVNSKQLANKYEIKYLDTAELFDNIKEYIPNPYNYYPNNKGYELISKEISQILAKLYN